MTFKLTERELDFILERLAAARKNLNKSDVEEKLESIQAWMQTMPAEDRVVYLLGRKA